MSNVFEILFHGCTFTGMTQRPTIHDVAAEAGVSIATVSKAINGRYGVKEETSRRVLEVVDRLGYASSLVASSMRSHRTGVIGVLVADFEPFSTEIMKGVAGELRSTDYDLLAYSGSRRLHAEGWERRSLSRLSGSLVDGVIMVTPTVLNAQVDVPIVAVDPHTGRADIPTVEADSLGGALLATRHLIELGHRRIGFLSGRPDLRSAILRETGYRRALQEAGIPFDPALVLNGDYRQDTAREPSRVLLSMQDRPTAIFAANDLSAIGLAATAAEMGVEIPGDVSIIGFDDIPEAARISPPLTTIRQPMQGLGAAAARLLVALMNGAAPSSPDVVLPTRLVQRGSTAPPR